MSRLFVATVVLVLLGCGWVQRTTRTVGPDPVAYSSADLQAAVAAAEPGDEIIIAPGRYELPGPLYVGVSVTLRAGGEVILELAGSKSGTLVNVGEGSVRLVGLSFRGGGVAITRPAEVFVQDCVFENCAVGIDSADTVVEVSGAQFVGCGIGVLAGGHALVRDSAFRGCRIGVKAVAATAVTLVGCHFSSNGIGVSGDHPCRVLGSRNEFSRNGIDLVGDLEPSLRVPQREGTETKVTYPGVGYGTLQEAVDALVYGGKLLLAASVAESATLDRALTVEPASPGTVRIGGAGFGETVLPALAVVGSGEVELRRVAMDEIVCGPRTRLSLKDVRVEKTAVVLTGEAEVAWEGGAGGLQLDREAAAWVSRVLLDQGVRLDDLARARLEDCEVGLPAWGRGAAVRLTGLSRLEAERVTVRGGVNVQDRGELVLSSSHLDGPSADGYRRVLSVGSFADVRLHDVIAEGGRAGMMVSSWGRPRLNLDGVTIRDCEVGLAVDIRCPEFDGIYGLWLPPLAVAITLGPRGLEFIACGVRLCPSCSDAVWPSTLCQALEMVTSDASPELLGSAGRGEAR